MEHYNYFANNDENEHIVEEHQRRVTNPVNVRRRLRDTLDPFDISVTEFMALYRIPQRLVFELTDLIRPYVAVRTNGCSIPLCCCRVLCALKYYAHGSYQRPMGNNIYQAVSQPTKSKFISEITGALNHPAILSMLVHFPLTRAKREQELERNANYGLPRVLGLADGNLIEIAPPTKTDDLERKAYYCRKGYPALNVQIVCSTDGYFFDVNARFPGSCNDPYIHNASGLEDVMREAYEDSRCWLLGDSIYPLQPWMHIPLPRARPGTPEYEYTRVHCKCRNPVERVNGVLKERWRCINGESVPHYSPLKVGRIVNACVVLHNFCWVRNVPEPELPVNAGNGRGNEEMDEEVPYPVNAGAAALRRQALENSNI